MTQAKQYAKDLTQEFIDFTYMEDQDGLYTPLSTKCALIALKRIKKALIEYGDDNFELQNMDSELRFYDEVEKELLSNL